MDTRRTSASEDTGQSDMDILDTLKREHDEVTGLLAKLVESTTGAAERKTLVGKIRESLVPHQHAEEKIVYDAVLGLRSSDAKQHGEEGVLEHSIAERTLTRLSKIENTRSPEFSAAAKVLKELVEHHVEEEEKNIWADVRGSFSPEQRIEMNRKFDEAKRRVRVPSAA